jgi:hypothetical protein
MNYGKVSRDLFIEEEIDGAFIRLLDEPVNYYLREGELSVPPLDVGGRPGRDAVYPEITISECERTEKERIVQTDTYSLTITFPVPEQEEAEEYCYAYAAALERALGVNPTLGGMVNRVVMTGKKYIRPKKPHCGEDWKLVVTLRVTVERIVHAG